MTHQPRDVPGGRARGLSVRWRLTLSYAGFLLLAWTGFLVVTALVLRYLPDENLVVAGGRSGGGFAPNRSDLVAAGAPLAAVGTLALLLVGLGGGWLLAGRMLAPLAEIERAVRDTAAGSLTHRIRMRGPDDEFRRMADVFDDMLQRLERAFDEQRRFASNASHELQTPLATTKTILEVALADRTGRDVDRLLARLQETNDRSIATVQALLRLSRAEHSTPDLTAYDLADACREAAEAAAEESADRGVTLDLALSSAPVRGDRVLLGQLVSNLLLNGVRHTGERVGPVVLRSHRGRDGAARLEVSNPGEELDPGVVATFTEPFVRGAGRVRSVAGPTGSGLGLSIVDAVARLHHARLELQPRPGGGLDATVVFPPVQASPTSARRPRGPMDVPHRPGGAAR